MVTRSRVKRSRTTRTTRKPVVTRVLKQTGARKSIHLDRKRKALKPGRRISKTGRKYTETRRNRSDYPSKSRT